MPGLSTRKASAEGQPPPAGRLTGVPGAPLRLSSEASFPPAAAAAYTLRFL